MAFVAAHRAHALCVALQEGPLPIVRLNQRDVLAKGQQQQGLGGACEAAAGVGVVTALELCT